MFRFTSPESQQIAPNTELVCRFAEIHHETLETTPGGISVEALRSVASAEIRLRNTRDAKRKGSFINNVHIVATVVRDKLPPIDPTMDARKQAVSDALQEHVLRNCVDCPVKTCPVPQNIPLIVEDLTG